MASERVQGVPREEVPAAIFGETADPHRYVPREATEHLLAALERCVVDEAGSALVSGPPGLGKSLVLRVLAERLSDSLSVVYLPYSALSFDELCAFVLRTLGEPASVADPETALRSAISARQACGSALALLIDEARALPVESARALARFSDECAGGLRLVVAGPDDARTSRVAAALDLDMDSHRLAQPLDEQEACEYVRARLRLAGASAAIRRRLGDETVVWLQRLSGGNPRDLHRLAESVLEGDPPPAASSRWDVAPADLAEPENEAPPDPIDMRSGCS